MKYKVEDSNYMVAVTAIDLDVAITAEAPLEISVGEVAHIDVGETITYIKAGTDEIATAVTEGVNTLNAYAMMKQTDMDAAVILAQYYAENVKFGMIPEYFAVADWVLNDGKYQLSYQYDVVAAVFKKNGSNYELMTNIDVITGGGRVTIQSGSAFEGYVLLVNSAEKVEDKTFVYEQAEASDTWVIEHNLGKYPSVEVADSTGNRFFPAVQWINENKCIVTMNGAIKGKAFLN